MIFTYFQLINICSPYKFMDILIIEILKVVEKVKFITIKSPREAWSKAFDKKIRLDGKDH